MLYEKLKIKKNIRHLYSYQKHRGCKSSALPLNHSNVCYINTKTDSTANSRSLFVWLSLSPKFQRVTTISHTRVP